MRLTPALLCAAIALSTAAHADDADAPAKPKPKPRMICTQERETGSFVKVQRTCMTKEERDRLADASQRELDRLDRGAQEGTLRGALDAGPAAIGAVNMPGGAPYQNQ